MATVQLVPQSFPVDAAGKGSREVAINVPGVSYGGKAFEPDYPGDSRIGESIAIAFRDLSYTVRKGDKDVQILQNVSACFLPGRMAAIMGPSGAGKTTLMDAIAGRKTQGTLSGQLVFGDKSPSAGFLKRHTGYVEQFDTLVDVLTVEEMLMYTAELKRPAEEPIAVKQGAVARLVTKLGLERCASTKIGNPLMRGISGGQAKRVNIGIALITNPKVLFLDEPTSGLDSATADDIMVLVKNMAHASGIAICSTIHSPTVKTFALFDDLLLLAKGRTVYFGPLNDGSAVRHFVSLGFPFTPGDNLADWLVQITGGGVAGSTDFDFWSAFERSPMAAAAAQTLQQLLPPPGTVLEKHHVTSATAVSIPKALAVLFRYRSLKNFATPDFLGPRFGDKVVFAFILFSLYIFMGPKTDATSIQNVVSSLFMVTTLPSYGAASYVPAIVLDRKLFTRERNDGCYLPFTYICFKMIEEAIVALAAAAVFVVVIFWSIQYQGTAGLFYITFYMTLLCGILLAYLIGAISPNMDVANAALPAYITILLFFKGLLILDSKMPNYWGWFRYLTFIRFSWRALMIDHFRGLGDPPLFADGRTTLQFYSMDGVSKWPQLGYLTLFIGTFFLLAWMALQYIRHEKR